MNLLKNKMGMRVLTLALCAALGGSVLAVKAESVAGETVVQEAVQDENMSESREIDPVSYTHLTLPTILLV